MFDEMSSAVITTRVTTTVNVPLVWSRRGRTCCALAGRPRRSRYPDAPSLSVVSSSMLSRPSGSPARTVDVSTPSRSPARCSPSLCPGSAAPSATDGSGLWSWSGSVMSSPRRVRTHRKAGHAAGRSSTLATSAPDTSAEREAERARVMDDERLHRDEPDAYVAVPAASDAYARWTSRRATTTTPTAEHDLAHVRGSADGRVRQTAALGRAPSAAPLGSRRRSRTGRGNGERRDVG